MPSSSVTPAEARTGVYNQRMPGQNFQHRREVKSGTQICNSFIYSHPKAVAASTIKCADDQLTSVSSCIGSHLQTSTQLSESEDKGGGHDVDTPLSPLQITLSQVCAMEEDSQPMAGGGDIALLTYEISTAKCLTATVEDSGYISREVSTFQSPSPHAKTVLDPTFQSPIPQVKAELDPSLNTQEIRNNLEKAAVGGARGNVDEDALFAEVTLEGLNDSLEEVEGNYELAVAHHPPGQNQLREHARNHQVSVSEVNSHSQFSPTVGHSKPIATTSTHCSGVVKPLMGSLLSARLNNARIHIKHVVGQRPLGRFTLTQLHSLGVLEDTSAVRASNAVDFSFSGWQYFSSAVLSGSPACVGDGAMLKLSPNGRAGVTEFWEAFRDLSCVDEKLISYEWFVNHYKQLVWKLASMEVCYPHLFGGRCLTPDWLMLQLKYRYDREIDRAERSALHKICENDDVPSKRMVLCVAEVYKEKLHGSTASFDATGKFATPKSSDVESGNETVIRSESAKDPTTTSNPPCVEVTDGWYSLPCVLDPPLKQMVKSGKVTVGTKLLIYGAELLGQRNPNHPLEMPSGCSLKISANSTRRARWFARLGYQPMPCPFPVPLMSIFPDGGLVGCTDVVITRVYPLVYLEKREGKKSVLRSERLERKIAALHESERQRKIDAICSKVQKEFEEEVAKQG